MRRPVAFFVSKKPPFGRGLLNSTKGANQVLGQSTTTVPHAKAANGSAEDHAPKVPNAIVEWFNRSVAKGQSRIHTEEVYLTPDLATLLLSVNDSNRPLSPASIQKYVADIKAGNWQMNGQPVIISNDGSLNDGQHRCHAVIETGVPVPVLMVFGVERDTRRTLDTGRVRRVSDFIKMDGAEPYNANAAGAAAMLLALFNRGFYSDKSITKAMVLQEYWSHEKAIETASKLVLNDWYIQGTRIPGGPSVHIAAYVLLAKANPVTGPAFIRRIVTGANLFEGDPALAVRNWLLTQRSNNSRKLECILRGWNQFRTRKGAFKKLVTVGSFPEIVR